LQQTLSKQLLEVHSVAAAQVWPLLSVQVPGCEPLHVPFAQLVEPQHTPSTQLSPEPHIPEYVHGDPCVARTTQALLRQK
jgi:hypothetical protein